MGTVKYSEVPLTALHLLNPLNIRARGVAMPRCLLPPLTTPGGPRLSDASTSPPSGPQQISVAPQPPGPPNVPSSVQAGADANLLVATVQLGSDQRHQAAITWTVAVALLSG